jgi:hypothetical protein
VDEPVAVSLDRLGDTMDVRGIDTEPDDVGHDASA